MGLPAALVHLVYSFVEIEKATNVICMLSLRHSVPAQQESNSQQAVNNLVVHVQQHKVKRSKVVGAATTGSAVAAQQEQITQ